MRLVASLTRAALGTWAITPLQTSNERSRDRERVRIRHSDTLFLHTQTPYLFCGKRFIVVRDSSPLRAPARTGYKNEIWLWPLGERFNIHYPEPKRLVCVGG